MNLKKGDCMTKNTKKRTMIFSNVKDNKKKYDEVSKTNSTAIDLDDEIIIGMKEIPKPKNTKKYNNNINNRKKLNKKTKKVNLKMNKKNKKQKRKMSNLKKRKILLLVKLVIIIAIVCAGIIIFLKSQIFNIKEVNISIENQKNLTETEIKSLSGINPEQNIWKLNKNNIIKSIKNNSYVASVKVNKKIPNKVSIKVEERSVKFQLKTGDQYIYIDNQGYILETSKKIENILVITGCETTDFTPGNRINQNDLDRLNDVVDIIQETENAGIKDIITSMDIQDDKDYKIYFDNNGKMAHIGDTKSLNDKITYVKKILELENNYQGEIFVNVDLNNGEYPYFRERV